MVNSLLVDTSRWAIRLTKCRYVLWGDFQVLRNLLTVLIKWKSRYLTHALALVKLNLEFLLIEAEHHSCAVFLTGASVVTGIRSVLAC